MKKLLFVCINLFFMTIILFADAAPVDVLPIERVIKISNASKIPDLIVLGCLLDENGNVMSKFKIEDNEVISYDDSFSLYTRNLFVVAVKRSLVEQAGIDNLKIEGMIQEGKLYPTRIYKPIQGFMDENAISSLCKGTIYEEIIYRICGVAAEGNKLFLEVEKKILRYTNGKEVVKEMTRNKEIKRIGEMVTAEDISSSSYLKSDIYYDRYNPVQVFDGDPETGWSEDVSGAGIDEWVEIRLEKPITIDKIRVCPGWFQKEYFKKNNRIKKMKIILDDYTIIADFKDTMEPQDVVLKAPKPFTYARFIIKDVYKTSEWDDTPLGEIQFFFQKKEISIVTTDIDTVVSQYEMPQ
jgi:hypothetical protein